MFPNADDTPSEFPEFSVHAAVTCAVASELRLPEFSILFGLRAVLRTAMPETAVYKHGNTKLRKNEIRFPEHGLMPPPTDDVIFTENFRQCQLRILVAMRPDTRHHFRTFGFRNYVGHIH
jgi:hypothetical protein